MNDGLNQPRNPSNRSRRRRKRNFRNTGQGQNSQGQNRQGGQNSGQSMQGGGQGRQNRRNRSSRGPRRSPAFVGPMDHSYRNQNGNGQTQGSQFRNGAPIQDNFEPLPQRDDAPTRIFAFVDDLFFLAKIQEVARKLNVKVDFVKTDQEIADRSAEKPDEKPALIIVDLNSNSFKPLPVVTKLRSRFKKPTSIVGFVQHVQGDLKLKAQDAGCDVVMPRSAFSQTLPGLLRRHATDEEAEDNFNRA